MDPKQLTFLVVEDHDFQRNVIVRMLHALNAKQVYAAANGRAALDILESLRSPVDIVVSDLDMPSMDGLEFIRHMGRGRYGTSLIVASALERGLLTSVENMASAYSINLLGTIEKPVTPAKLKELIKLHEPAKTGAPRLVAVGRTYTLEEIVDGLENDQFEPHYQPKVDIKTRRVVGAEALARWHHPRDGRVAPGSFIRQLEQGGKIDLLMRRILRKSARFLTELHAHGHNAQVCVNVSVASLRQVQVAEEITQIVRAEGGDPRCIVLEITESEAMTDLGTLLENLARLRMKGFGLAIDDYGTGYSSMEQLSRIPFSELKIDQSFVTHAARHDATRVILASTLEMAHRLNIRSIAEGVETRADWDLLSLLECDIAQGYYISKPLPEARYLEWLAQWSELHALAAPARFASQK